MGLSMDNKTNNSNGKLNGLESQLVEGETVVYFASMAEDLNSGLPRTNPATVRAGIDVRASGLQDQRSNRFVVLPLQSTFIESTGKWSHVSLKVLDILMNHEMLAVPQ